MSNLGRVRSILRHLRLQVKVGIRKEYPWEYDYIRRNPPLLNQFQPESMAVQSGVVPYYNLYKKVLDRDPRYHDERVAPGHDFDATEALTLAKAQYNYMKEEGLSEDDAYRKATNYVDSIENESFLRMKHLIKLIEKEGPSLQNYLSDPSVKQTLAAFQQKLNSNPYKLLSLAEKGELDKFVQVFILYWNEIERERRMKDFVFKEHFDQLIQILFPVSNEAQLRLQRLRNQEQKEAILTKLGIHPSFRAVDDFFVEDYLHFFNQLKESPHYEANWAMDEKAVFNEWTENTLALQSLDAQHGEDPEDDDDDDTFDFVNEEEENEEEQSESNLALNLFAARMMISFFPMIIFPKRAAQLPSYTMDEIRELCYDHQIGYKKDEKSGKLYIRRFYKLPKILYPRDSFCAEIVMNPALLDEMLANPEKLAKAVKEDGLDAALVPEIRQQLEDYRFQRESQNLGGSQSDMEMLDTILRDINQSEGGTNVLDEIQLNIQAEEESKQEKEAEEEQTEEASQSKQTTTPPAKPANWEALLKKYFFLPQNELQRLRLQHFLDHHDLKVEDLYSEEQLQELEENRTTWGILMRNDLTKEYLQKEGARLNAEWKARGVNLGHPKLDAVFEQSDPLRWMTELPKKNKDSLQYERDQAIIAAERKRLRRTGK